MKLNFYGFDPSYHVAQVPLRLQASQGADARVSRSASPRRGGDASAGMTSTQPVSRAPPDPGSRKGEPIVTSPTALVTIKVAHTVVWVFFVACIFAIPVASWLGEHRAAAWFAAIVFIDVAILLLNGWRCRSPRWLPATRTTAATTSTSTSRSGWQGTTSSSSARSTRPAWHTRLHDGWPPDAAGRTVRPFPGDMAAMDKVPHFADAHPPREIARHGRAPRRCEGADRRRHARRAGRTRRRLHFARRSFLHRRSHWSSLGFGVTRLLGGLSFCLGLVLVVVAGAELFTGNNLLAMAWASRLISTRDVLRNWILVYLGNVIGCLGTVLFVVWADIASLGGGAVGETAIQIARAKAGLSLGEAFARGVLCNALVCLAVWLAMGGRSVADKILADPLPHHRLRRHRTSSTRSPTGSSCPSGSRWISKARCRSRVSPGTSRR